MTSDQNLCFIPLNAKAFVLGNARNECSRDKKRGNEAQLADAYQTEVWPTET
jgi:hypothetical protein